MQAKLAKVCLSPYFAPWERITTVTLNTPTNTSICKSMLHRFQCFTCDANCDSSELNHLELKCRALMSNHYFRMSNTLVGLVSSFYVTWQPQHWFKEGRQSKTTTNCNWYYIDNQLGKWQTELIKSCCTFLLFVGTLLSLSLFLILYINILILIFLFHFLFFHIYSRLKPLYQPPLYMLTSSIIIS